MTTARKKKKQKTEVKPSKQLRNWLINQEKPKRTPPVSFHVFSSIVENLPDIAFQIQCCEVDFATKTLDECAQWFYNAFYSEPTIRKKYEFRLKSCPMKLREKLMQIPGASTPDVNAPDTPELDNGMVVKVKNHGRFLFPISYATFTQYIDKKKLLGSLVKKQTNDETQQKNMLADNAVCKNLLHKYYNSFYLYPSSRNLKQCGIKHLPVGLQTQFFKLAKPLDEVAVKTMADSANMATSNENQPQNEIVTSPSSIVSFEVFEQHIKNIYEISWRLKLNEQDYAYKGFDDCAFAYYLAFYLTPEIRDKHPYELKPCTSSMRDRILALPNESDVRLLLQLQNQEIIRSQEVALQEENATRNIINAIESAEEIVTENNEPLPMVEEVITVESIEQIPPIEEDTALRSPKVALPVTFQQFKRYIRNLDDILQEMETCEDILSKSKDERALEFYNAFYLSPQIRDKFKCEFKPCPAKMREKLLQVPKEEDKSDPTVDTNCSTEFPVERKLVTIKGITYEFLVSFKTFMRYINYEELKSQPFFEHEKKKGTSEEKLLKRFYNTFYTNEKFRKKFSYNFNAAPANLRIRLMQLALPFDRRKKNSKSEVRHKEPTTSNKICPANEEPEQQAPKTCTEQNRVDQIVCADCELDVLEVLEKSGRFRFPVSIETFKRCINYDELIGQLLTRITQDEAQLNDYLANPNNIQSQKIFKRYYHSFYVKPHTRSLFKFQFRNVSEELLQKLLEFAQPLDENAERVIAEAAKEMEINSAKEQEHSLNSNSLSSIVSFKVFKQHIKDLDEISWRLKLNEPDYAYKDFDDCAFAYYLAFYLTPEIRDKHPYELKPCTSSMRDRILALPNESDVQLLIQLQNQEIIRSQEVALQKENASNNTVNAIETAGEIVTESDEQLPMVEEVITEESDEQIPPIEEVTAKSKQSKVALPVTFQQFKRYLRNLDDILQQMESCDDFLGKSKDERALEFYNAFYISPHIRDKFKCEFKPCPAKMREKLLQMAKEENKSDPTGDTDCRTEFPVERKLVTIKGITYEFLVSFKTFMRYINYEELKSQPVFQNEKKRGKSLTDEQLLKRFYYSFYTNEKFRKKFSYNFNAAPANLRIRLMQLALPFDRSNENSNSEVPQNEPTTSNKICVASKELKQQPKSSIEQNRVDQIVCADCELDVLEVLEKSGRFRFPVSIETFKRCINYDELIGQLLTRITQDEAQLNDYLVNPNNIQSQKIFKRYYHSFYVKPHTRSLFKFHFRNVSAELLQKLLEFAQPLDENSKRVMAEAAEEMALIAAKKPEQKQANEELHALPVSFKLFKSYIKNLEEIVKKMRSCEEYRHKTDDECALMFYKAFYRDPQIRDKFEVELKPCPAKIRAKLFCLPTAVPETETETNNCKSAPAEIRADIELEDVDVERIPEKLVVLSEQILIPIEGVTYEFPVSLGTFKKYINYEALKVELTKSNSKNPENIECNLKDETNNLRLLEHFYHSFYIDERVRNMYNYNFNAAPAKLQEKLLQFAVPLKEIAVQLPEPSTQSTSLNAVSIQKDSHNELAKYAEPVPPLELIVNQQKFPQLHHLFRIKFPVSFNIFSSLFHLESSVKQMQQDPQYANMNENECRRAFFKAFYTTPEIRKKYSWSLRPCPADLQTMLLKIPKRKPVGKHHVDVVNFLALQAERKAELETMQKSNVVEYNFNLTAYRAKISLEERIETEKPMAESSKASKASAEGSKASAEGSKASAEGFKALAEPLKVSKPSAEDPKALSEPSEACKASAAGSKALAKPFNTSKKSAEGSKVSAEPSEALSVKVSKASKTSSEDPKSSKAMPESSKAAPGGSKASAEPFKASNVSAEPSEESKTSAKDSKASTEPSEASKASTEGSKTSDKGSKASAELSDASSKSSKESKASAEGSNASKTSAEDSKALKALSESSKALPAGLKASAEPSEAPKASPTDSKASTEPLKASKASASDSNASAKTSNTSKASIQGSKTSAEGSEASSEGSKASKASADPFQASKTSAESSKASTAISEASKASVEGSKALTESSRPSVSKSTANPERSPAVSMEKNTTESRVTTSEASEQAGSQSSTSTKSSIADIAQASATTTSSTSIRNMLTKCNPQTSMTVKEFFATSDRNHKIDYLLYTSHGLRKTIWLILSQLTFEEFKKYIVIYGDTMFSKDADLLNQLYQHVVLKGNWPLNLFLNLKDLPQLLHSKGVVIDTLDLQQLSPKILHWSELIKLSNIFDVVEHDFQMRTGKNIDTLCNLFIEVEKFYTLCWTQDQWIEQIVGEKIIQLRMSNATGNVLSFSLPLCMLDINKAANEAVAEGQHIPELNVATVDVSDSDCPSTQLETSLSLHSFVDMESLDPASQAIETQNDPLFEPVIPVPVRALPSQVPIKAEPVPLLNKLLFTLNSNPSEEFNCESIHSEEQVINLDGSEAEHLATDLAVLVMPQINENKDKCTQSTTESSTVALEQLHKSDNIVSDVNDRLRSRKTALAVDVASVKKTTDALKVTKRKSPQPEEAQASKKKRLRIPDNVPQFRHEFRALPLSAMVRIEPDVRDTVSSEAEAPQQELSNSNSGPMTTSQELSTDNTLMASSQLQHLLDAPFVSTRKVNEQNVASLSDKHDMVVANPLSLHTNIIFCDLQRFMFFKSLTTAQISKYHINSISVGSPYQQALICANGQLCNVYGPLLAILFPQCSASLLSDLQYLLWVVGEFNYNCRKVEATEDLRHRVLYTFMKSSSPFSHFRLHFENDTREWAACSSIEKADSEIVQRKPSCDISSAINPKILERMKQIKSSYYHQYYNENK